MADTDFDVRRDELERDNLQRTISEVETALAVSTPGTRPLWENLLGNAKGGIGVLEKKIKEAQEARETHEREQMAVAALAQKETALSAREKETYSGFLKEDFFTKKDFGRLEQFYEKTWDRLSEGGKNQMSQRIWEGIRHHEYTFDQLPPKVREKETERAYEVLKKREAGAEKATAVPEADRQDFIRAYENGKREEASKILERDSFRENMFRGPESKSIKHAAAQKDREADGDAVAKRSSDVAGSPGEIAPAQESGSKADLDLSALNMDGVKLVEAPAQSTSADIPSAKPASPKGGPSLRSS